MKPEKLKVKLRYGDDICMWVLLSLIHRVGEFIRLPESDSTEEHMVRVTYDLRRDENILLDVQQVQDAGERK